MDCRERKCLKRQAGIFRKDYNQRSPIGYCHNLIPLAHHPRRCSGHRQDHPVRSSRSNRHRHDIFTLFFAEISRPFKAKLRRSFATVQDPPVRRYGGLKDQDRIFTNAYCRHDHGIKGAMVCLHVHLFARTGNLLTCSPVSRRLASDERHSRQG